MVTRCSKWELMMMVGNSLQGAVVVMVRTGEGYSRSLRWKDMTPVPESNKQVTLDGEEGYGMGRRVMWVMAWGGGLCRLWHGEEDYVGYGMGRRVMWVMAWGGGLCRLWHGEEDYVGYGMGRWVMVWEEEGLRCMQMNTGNLPCV